MDATGIRLRDVIAVDNMMWDSDNSHSESLTSQWASCPEPIFSSRRRRRQGKIPTALRTAPVRV
jgi:hypothetical protein